MEEIKKVSGEQDINGSIAYVEQDPFIFAGTVKDNILFGKQYNERRFNDVLSACELEYDAKMLPDGINTVIGEKGINVSGG